jgi:hypothetical protein
MARVPQTTIDKTLKTIGNLKTSPTFPSNDELLESNMTLCNVVSMVRGMSRNVPEKTICGLLVEALEISKDVSGEALWKRYRRSTVTSGDGSIVNRDTKSSPVSTENIYDNINRDDSIVNRAGFTVNRDTVLDHLFIPAGISQADLAAGLAEFFESLGYTSSALMKTFLMALNGMAESTTVSEIKDAIDAFYLLEVSA